jgi:hypothetical protein
MGALTSLNLAENSLGEPVLPEGWTHSGYTDEQRVGELGLRSGCKEWEHSDGSFFKPRTTEKPGKPEGAIAIVNVIPDMGALAKLDMSRNGIGAGQGFSVFFRAAWEEDLQRICMAGGIELTK